MRVVTERMFMICYGIALMIKAWLNHVMKTGEGLANTI